MIRLPTPVLTAPPHSPAVCPVCQNRRLRYTWSINSTDQFRCRKCGRRFAHIARHTASGLECGLEEIEDLIDPADEHRYIQAHERTFAPCFPPEALELSGITQRDWRRQSSTAENLTGK